MISVIVAADIRLYREGLGEILGHAATLTVVATAADWPQTIESVRDLRPDVVLVDMAMGDSVGSVQALAATAPEVKIVALAVPEIGREVVAYAEAGVHGYVTREASLEELVAAVESIARGELIVSPRMAASLLQHVTTLARGRTSNWPEVRLTSRELEVVALIDEGLSNKQIGAELCIELPTVKNHVHNILEKLHVSRRSEAAARVRGGRAARMDLKI